MNIFRLAAIDRQIDRLESVKQSLLAGVRADLRHVSPEVLTTVTAMIAAPLDEALDELQQSRTRLLF